VASEGGRLHPTFRTHVFEGGAWRNSKGDLRELSCEKTSGDAVMSRRDGVVARKNPP